ncbi:tetratricopeptide repeat protein [Hymenobacter lutimineralis]|uniref:Tetratricopeptide repeat protein n=2 Tax=Hymenobacter lutimineralis TaxID=2606448 RepID=A0A5D6V9E9_9BACT|nr:tetratricopeptide repeat protein [Hymenobacter lutimineralis]
MAQSGADAEDLALAREYARKGDYAKAEVLFGQLPDAVQQNGTVLPEYLRTMQELRHFKEAEKLARKAQRRRPEDPLVGVLLGRVLETSGDKAGAAKQYERVVAGVKPDQVLAVANDFQENQQLEWAEKVYLRGRELARNNTEYAPQLIQLYTRQPNTERLMAETLRLVQQDERQLPFVRNMLQNSLREEKDFDALEKLLLTSVQQHPEQSAYSELLLWLYVQRKDFAGAMVQARALDRRTRSEGSRILDLAAIALRNKDYESAIAGYEYVSREYRGGQYYSMARQLLLHAREEQVRNTFPVDAAKIRTLLTEYQQLLTEFGAASPFRAEVLRNMAELHAFQLGEKDKAMALLQEAISLPRANAETVDRAKLTLADLYLLRGEPWEATLLYSQVEKTHKDSPLGYDAKLRNARLSYFAGDFKLAQSHLDILKEATSREIANDAMQLSLLITDNTAMDTAGIALRDYAATELLVFQNKIPEAIRSLDALGQKYPGHALQDEAWYLKAQLQRRTADYASAVQTLARITENPKYDVLSDDALFLAASIQEENLNDREKAQELYNQVIIKYPGSIYVAEARKRFRKLRGDAVN